MASLGQRVLAMAEAVGFPADEVPQGMYPLSLPYASANPEFAQAVNATPVNGDQITIKTAKGTEKTVKTQVPAYFRDYSTLRWSGSDNLLVPAAVGAKDDSGTDINFSATKLILGGFFNRNLLLNGNLRYTKANQTGLVGFGGDKNNSYELLPEVSAGVLVNRHWLVGTEYRQKPDNLSFIKEDDWQTVFVGWFPNKRIALVAAWVDLGEVATFKDQTGWYLSLQGSF